MFWGPSMECGAWSVELELELVLRCPALYLQAHARARWKMELAIPEADGDGSRDTRLGDPRLLPYTTLPELPECLSARQPDYLTT